jgi:DivIVA domain-containing protein
VLGVRETPLTADEVRDQKFPITLWEPCYDPKEVDAFLAEVEARLRTRCAECGAPAAALTQTCAECGAPAAGPPSDVTGPAPGGPGDRL